MKLKTLTWNIGGGKVLEEGADPTRLASYTVDGLSDIIATLRAENPDIITLQETQRKAGYDQVKLIAEALGYAYVHDSTSDSHIDTDCQLGHAILTRHTISSHTTGFFYNPKLQIAWEDGSTATSFDKGYSTCQLLIYDTPVTVTTLHLIPFRRFDLALDTELAKTILKNVEDTVRVTDKFWLIQGDFNIDSPTVQHYLPGIFDSATTEVELTAPTTPKNHSYDHIIARRGTILSHRIISDVRTDHYPVVAEIEITT